MKRKSEAAPFDFTNAASFAPLAAFNGPMATAMLRSSEVFAKGMQTIPAEIAGFIGKRVKADAKLYAECTKCNGWEDWVSLQQNWLKETSEAYLKEANQMMAISQNLFSDAAKAAADTTKDIKAEEKASPTE